MRRGWQRQQQLTSSTTLASAQRPSAQFGINANGGGNPGGGHIPAFGGRPSGLGPAPAAASLQLHRLFGEQERAGLKPIS